MANHLTLPTTVEEFILFLEGASISPYCKKGNAIIDALQSVIQDTVYKDFTSHFAYRYFYVFAA